MMKKTVVAGLVTMFTMGAAHPALATPVTTNVTIDVTVQTQLVLEALDCQNSLGHYITVGGSQSGLPGVTGLVTFKSPSNKAAASTDKQMLLDPGPTTYLDKRGVGGGVGGNPWIYIAGNGGTPNLLGRCVQGFRANWSLNRNVQIPVTAASRALACSSSGSELDTTATPVNSVGTALEITFDNKAPDNPSTPRPHKGAAAVTFSLTSTGGYAPVGRHKGIGGNPDVYLNIATGDPVGAGAYIGRCRSLL